MKGHYNIKNYQIFYFINFIFLLIYIVFLHIIICFIQSFQNHTLCGLYKKLITSTVVMSIFCKSTDFGLLGILPNFSTHKSKFAL